MSDRNEFARLLRAYFEAVGTLSPVQVEALWRHYELLTRWNKVLNLTGVRRLEEAVRRHYCESLFVALHLPPEPVSVLDIGSGAGFPGIPMAVVRPDCRFTLAESHRRKAAFLREATREFANVEVAAERAEALQGRFDWVVSRAVRWETIRKDVVRLGRCVALLAGKGDAAKIQATKSFRWQPPVPLPWSAHGVLVLGNTCSTWNISEDQA